MPSYCVNALALPEAEPPAECSSYATRDTAAWVVPTVVVAAALYKAARSKWARGHLAQWREAAALRRRAPQIRTAAEIRFVELRRRIEARQFAPAADGYRELLQEHAACGNFEVVQTCAVRGMLLAALASDLTLATTICDAAHVALQPVAELRREAAQLRVLLHLLYRIGGDPRDNLEVVHAMYAATAGRRINVIDVLEWLQPQLLEIGVPGLAGSIFQPIGAYLHTIAPPDQDEPGSVPPRRRAAAAPSPAAGARPTSTGTTAAPPAAAATTAAPATPPRDPNIDDRFRMLELD